MTEMEERMMELLPIGKDNAITQSELAGLMGIDTRSVRFLANSLRTEIPLCSGNEGYWIGNDEDIIMSVRRMQSQIKTLTESCDALMKHLEDDYYD